LTRERRATTLVLVRFLGKALPTAVFLGSLALFREAWALPKEGDLLATAVLVDADGARFDTATTKGKPLLIVYEDKDSGKDNQTLKDELAALAKDGNYTQAVALVAVADVSAYDFWPARGFVKDAIRKESRKAGTTIYCDWDGSFRSKLSLNKGKSNIVLVGKSGKVLYAAQGAMGANARLRLFGLLKGEVVPAQAPSENKASGESASLP